MLPHLTMPREKWPVYPLAASGSSYFVLHEGYFVAGSPEPLTRYISYCRTKGKFRTERLPVPTRRQALKDAESLRQSEVWKAIKWKDEGPGTSYELSEEKAWDFIKAQAEKTPEK